MKGTNRRTVPRHREKKKAGAFFDERSGKQTSRTNNEATTAGKSLQVSNTNRIRCGACGTAEELRQMADALHSRDSAMLSQYEARGQFCPIAGEESLTKLAKARGLPDQATRALIGRFRRDGKVSAAFGSLPQLEQKLPKLACNAVLIGHEQRADVVWTEQNFDSVWRHMHNKNEPNFFMIPYCDEHGVAKYAKAKKARVERQASWAWDTITGRAKRPASIGFYPRNERGETRWAAMDFDNHTVGGDGKNARRLALDAFELLYRHPQFFVALTTSGGGGWHLFVFTREFHPCAEWERLLRQVAALIGSPIEKGRLEIFPSSTRGRTGYGIRAPGTWNPKNGQFSLIAFENVSEPLSLLYGEREPLSLQSSVEGRKPDLTDRRKRAGFLLSVKSFGITAPRSRHSQLAALVGYFFPQVSRCLVRDAAERQWREASPASETDLEMHLSEFEELWEGLERSWLTNLGQSERARFDALRTDFERVAFKIVFGFARLAGEGDFPIAAENLADRIGATLQTGSNIRRRFCVAGILHQTAPFISNRAAARYRWIANQGQTL